MNQEQVKVESGVPLPGARHPFGQMKVGDSFAIPAGVARTTVSVAAKRYGDKHGMAFVTRTLPDGTIRCWRTA